MEPSAKLISSAEKSSVPVDRDVVRSRASDARMAMLELKRLAALGEMDVDEKYAMRYNVIVLVEALVSLSLHIAAEELGVYPRSYREAVALAAGRLGVGCAPELEKLVGLRNLHRYWEIDDENIRQAVKKTLNGGS